MQHSPVTVQVKGTHGKPMREEPGSWRMSVRLEGAFEAVSSTLLRISFSLRVFKDAGRWHVQAIGNDRPAWRQHFIDQLLAVVGTDHKTKKAAVDLISSHLWAGFQAPEFEEPEPEPEPEDKDKPRPRFLAVGLGVWGTGRTEVEAVGNCPGLPKLETIELWRLPKCIKSIGVDCMGTMQWELLPGEYHEPRPRPVKVKLTRRPFFLQADQDFDALAYSLRRLGFEDMACEIEDLADKVARIEENEGKAN